MSTMVLLEVPHLNILSKCDLYPNWANDREFERFVEVDLLSLVADMRDSTPTRHKRLTEAISTLLEEWNMISFIPLDLTNEDTLQSVLLQVDNAIQYGEDTDVRVKDYADDDQEHNDD
eukprot:c16358_g1_i2.p2 GENE.c16358_g1_i2~~c16358_g1_i2.p2  ORF type:complete len:118 (-),score=36.46 c16358_g1_i2:88-441(-)